MTTLTSAGSFRLGDRTVNRMGYGAMQLAGPGVFGPPGDRAEAIAVLREAVAAGVNHIDTSDFYGPHVTNQIIAEALHPYPAGLTIVTKVGAARGPDASWNPAFSPGDIVRAVHDNLKNLRVDAIDVVNLRIMGKVHEPSEMSIAPQFEALARLREKGLVRHLGLSNATSAQVKEARGVAEVVCVQNQYNVVAPRGRPADRRTRGGGDRLRAVLPARRLFAAAIGGAEAVAADLGATPMQTALAWLLHRAPNILLIPGTSSRAHLRENLAAAKLELPEAALARLDAIGGAGS